MRARPRRDRCSHSRSPTCPRGAAAPKRSAPCSMTEPGTELRIASSLQRSVRIRDRSPHVRDGTAVVAEAFLRLLEAPADEVDERLDADHRVRVERVEIAYSDFARRIVPAVR